MSSCKITPTPPDPACPFHAETGSVTLTIKDVTGAVEFLKARYNGAPLPGTPSKEISFTIISGSHDLEVVYTFSDTGNGEGELREVCDSNTLLDKVHADIPAISYTICA